MHAQSGRREPKGARQPLEQRDAEVILEDLDLPADRGLRDVQFLGGSREAEVPRGRLEDHETIRRR